MMSLGVNFANLCEFVIKLPFTLVIMTYSHFIKLWLIVEIYLWKGKMYPKSRISWMQTNRICSDNINLEVSSFNKFSKHTWAWAWVGTVGRKYPCWCITYCHFNDVRVSNQINRLKTNISYTSVFLPDCVGMECSEIFIVTGKLVFNSMQQFSLWILPNLCLKTLNKFSLIKTEIEHLKNIA